MEKEGDTMPKRKVLLTLEENKERPSSHLCYADTAAVGIEIFMITRRWHGHCGIMQYE